MNDVKQLSFLEPIEIPLTKGYVALVDPVDMDLLDRKWNARRSGHTFYATRGRRKPPYTILMHRLILSRVLQRPLSSREQVDHINGDGLDNRRCNLRLATNSENQCNARIRRNNMSGYKGVSWDKYCQKWRVQIRIEGKVTYVGLFDNSHDAARAYNEAALHYYGEFARLNEVSS